MEEPAAQEVGSEQAEQAEPVASAADTGAAASAAAEPGEGAAASAAVEPGEDDGQWPAVARPPLTQMGGL
eukprot:1715436-Lingulodinium_polyedra.AAC.1